ncbi:MAG TPA: hypothetical protein VFQ86_01870 [Arachidicoccus soli]|nr:hypothetical protein [Arachidicoccus soli]
MAAHKNRTWLEKKMTKIEKLDEWILFDARRPNVEVDRAGVKQVLDMIIDSNNEQEARIKGLEDELRDRDKVKALAEKACIQCGKLYFSKYEHECSQDQPGIAACPYCHHIEPHCPRCPEWFKYQSECNPQFKVGDIVEDTSFEVGEIVYVYLKDEEGITYCIDYGDNCRCEYGFNLGGLATPAQRKEFIKEFGDRSKGER